MNSIGSTASAATFHLIGFQELRYDTRPSSENVRIRDAQFNYVECAGTYLLFSM